MPHHVKGGSLAVVCTSSLLPLASHPQLITYAPAAALVAALS
ncbi:hypothetical protein ACDW_21270 [Acidovorax sp. DW039]|nr:hypothetical protein ACDW_21270 [Acidovorax sp. DW039]